MSVLVTNSGGDTPTGSPLDVGASFLRDMLARYLVAHALTLSGLVSLRLNIFDSRKYGTTFVDRYTVRSYLYSSLYRTLVILRLVSGSQSGYYDRRGYYGYIRGMEEFS